MRPNGRLLKATRQWGFTLIEVLIVMFIISIVLTVITLNVSVFSTDRFQLDKAIQTLSYQIQWAQEKSLMSQSTYRLVFVGNGYRFERYDEVQKNWQTVVQPKSMRAAMNNAWSLQAFDASNQVVDSIVFSPNQDLIAFTVVLSTQKDARGLQHLPSGQLEVLNEVP